MLQLPLRGRLYVVWQCLSGTSGPTSSTVYEHISLVGFLAGTFLKVGWKIFLVICWSFWYPTWKSPTIVLVEDIFCLLHTLNFGKVFFCLDVCIIPTKECFLKPSEVPVSYVYIHISEVPASYVYIHISDVPVSYVYIWSPNKGCLRCCCQGPIVCLFSTVMISPGPALQDCTGSRSKGNIIWIMIDTTLYW